MGKKKKSGWFWKIRVPVEYFLFRWILTFLEQLPVTTAYALGQALGTLIYWLDRPHRRRILENLELAYPQGPLRPAAEIAKGVFVHFSLVLMEFALARRLIHRQTWRQYTCGPDIAAFEKDRASLHGAVLTTGHFGNWEVLGLVTTFLGYEMTTVFRPLENPLINAYFNQLRERCGQKMIRKKEAYSALKEVLAQGGYPTLVMDQYAGRKGVIVDFFGHPASTVAGPAALALHYGVPIYVGAMMRSGTFRFRLHIEPVAFPPLSGDKEKDIQAITAAMTQKLEGWIRLYPEQWFWMHRRWRPLQQEREQREKEVYSPDPGQGQNLSH